MLYTDNFDQFFSQRGRALAQLIENAMGKTVARAEADFLALAAENEYVEDPQEWTDDGAGQDGVAETTPDIEVPTPTLEREASPAAAPPQVDDLEREFHQAMVDVYVKAKRELNYPASYFFNMVQEYGGLGTAKRLLAKSEISDGFVELWVRGRLDLSVEAQVLRLEFQPLFAADELAIAERRLAEVGYTVDR